MRDPEGARAAQNERETTAMLLIAFGLMMGGIVGLTVGLMTSRGCGHIEIKDAPWGCWEFALARYQTSIAAMIAALALLPVFRQLREMRKQSAFGAAGVVLSLTKEMGPERDYADKAHRELIELAKSILMSSEVRPWELYGEANKMLEGIDSTLQNFHAESAVEALEPHRRVAIKAVRGALSALPSNPDWPNQRELKTKFSDAVFEAGARLENYRFAINLTIQSFSQARSKLVAAGSA